MVWKLIEFGLFVIRFESHAYLNSHIIVYCSWCKFIFGLGTWPDFQFVLEMCDFCLDWQYSLSRPFWCDIDYVVAVLWASHYG